MVDDVATRLRAALGDGYALQRELRGGGMSRVFVATDRALDREVAVKLLPPELACDASASRFRREIELLAHLQHPHILPVLAAGGDERSVLFYVMPYLAGESLRERLSREGTLPVSDAVRLTCEIADALDYAHRQGVVHRDVKPDNVLLADGHAVLTDFGIARALSAATAGVRTTTGFAVGTPGYMSPEQAVGDAQLDGRADIYALGVVAYELLVGRPPFAGAFPGALVAAHLTQVPAPVRSMRHDVPRSVSEAIAKALAKAPGARFASAADFRRALDGAAAPWSPGRRGRAVALGGGLVAAALGAWTLASRRADVATLDANVVAVAPVDVLTPDLELWREGLVGVLSRNLDGAGALRTVPPSAVIKGWRGRSDRASAETLGRRTRARFAVFGTLQRSGRDSARLTLTLIDAATGETVGDIDARDAVERMDRLADSATVGLLRLVPVRGGVRSVRVGSVGTRSLPALKDFLRAEQLYRRVSLDSAELFYRRAIDRDSTFALAYSGLARAVAWVRSEAPSGRAEAAPYVDRAASLATRLSPRDSLIVMVDALSNAAYAAVAVRREGPIVVRLLRTTERLVRDYPTDADAWHAHADVRFHFGSVVNGVTDADVYHGFARAIALDSAYAPAYVHAIRTAYILGGAALGTRYLDAFVRHGAGGKLGDGARLARALTAATSGGPTAVRTLLDTSVLATIEDAMNVLTYAPDDAELEIQIRRRILELRQRRVPSDVAGVEAAELGLALALIYRGHLGEAATMPSVRRTWRATVLADLGAIPPPAAERLAAATLQTTSGAPECGSWVRWWSARGDTVSIAACRRLWREAGRQAGAAVVERMADGFARVVAVYDPLARRDTAAALASLATGYDSLCVVQCVGPELVDHARLLAAVGRRQEAFARITGRWPGAKSTLVPIALERARIASSLGRRQDAVTWYSLVADAWAHGDSGVQPYVREARNELQRLGADTRLGGAAQE